MVTGERSTAGRNLLLGGSTPAARSGGEMFRTVGVLSCGLLLALALMVFEVGLSDEDVDRVAERVAERIADAPAAPTPTQAAPPPSPTAAPPPITPANTAAPVPTYWVGQAVEGLAHAYARIQGVWTGYDPNDHPAVVPRRTADGDIPLALALNFPSPEGLGTAVPLDTTGTPIRSLHRIDGLNDATAATLKAIQYFEFNVMLAGVDAFVLMGDEADPVLDPATIQGGVTFIHEMFHRHQQTAFQGPHGFQDVEGYAYDAENLGLAVLEDRALTAAVTTDNADARATAVRHFAAVRMARMARLRTGDRVVLEDEQERAEGTARYLEHRLAGDDTRYTYHGANYHRDILSIEQLLAEGLRIKDHFGFGRFYATGAAIMHLLVVLGVADADRRVTAGESPGQVLLDHLGVPAAEVYALVAAARTAYDPTGEIPDAAARAAAGAAKEGPVFLEDGSGE